MLASQGPPVCSWMNGGQHPKWRFLAEPKTSSECDLQTLKSELNSKTSFAPFGSLEFRLPPIDVFKIHKPAAAKSHEVIWVRQEDPDCKCSNSAEALPTMPPPVPPRRTLYGSDEGSSCTTTLPQSKKAVSISVIRLTSDNISKKSQFQKDLEANCVSSEPSYIVDSKTVDTTSSTSTKSAPLSSCIRYHKPISIFLLTIGAIILMTCSVLYWNYYETMNRRQTKQHGRVILDHWGKGAPSELETIMLANQELETNAQRLYFDYDSDQEDDILMLPPAGGDFPGFFKDESAKKEKQASNYA